MTVFDPDALLEVLHRHDVQYVLIGGLAAALRGSATPTFDVDITPAADAANLARLSAALTELDARVRVDGISQGLAFSHDVGSLAQMTMLNLVTRFGDLDIAFEPAGITDYSQWQAHATLVTVLGVPVQVASLDVTVPAESPAATVARLVPDLRAELERLGEAGQAPGAPRAVVGYAPDEVRRLTDTRGPVPSLALIEAVKDEFDPEHRMAPGRIADAA